MDCKIWAVLWSKNLIRERQCGRMLGLLLVHQDSISSIHFSVMYEGEQFGKNWYEHGSWVIWKRTAAHQFTPVTRMHLHVSVELKVRYFTCSCLTSSSKLVWNKWGQSHVYHCVASLLPITVCERLGTEETSCWTIERGMLTHSCRWSTVLDLLCHILHFLMHQMFLVFFSWQTVLCKFILHKNIKLNKFPFIVNNLKFWTKFID